MLFRGIARSQSIKEVMDEHRFTSPTAGPGMGRSGLMAALVDGEGKLDELWMKTLASAAGIPPEELKRRADETDASWAGPTS